jgi:hypothetical protein
MIGMSRCPKNILSIQIYTFFNPYDLLDIGIKDINRSIMYDANMICGTRYLHSFRTKTFENMFAFDTRKQSYFCPFVYMS